MVSKEMYVDKRIIKTKKALKEALISLIEQNNFHDISITDIVTEARISRVTFYNHYQDKDGLLEELVSDVVADLIKTYRSPYETYKIFTLDDVAPTTVKLFDHVYQNGSFYTTIIHSDISTVFQNRLGYEIYKVSLQDYSVQNRKINNELYASYQANAIAGMITGWVGEGFKYSPMYMAEQLMEIMKLPATQSLERKNNR